MRLNGSKKEINNLHVKVRTKMKAKWKLYMYSRALLASLKESNFEIGSIFKIINIAFLYNKIKFTMNIWKSSRRYFLFILKPPNFNEPIKLLDDDLPNYW